MSSPPSPWPARGLRTLVYGALAVMLTWPASLHLGEQVPGAGRSDLGNSLWSLFFVQDRLGAGTLPWRTALLGWPDGGVLLVADPLNAVLALPLIAAFGLLAAYALLAMAHVAFSGLAAHSLAVYLSGKQRAGWVAGVSFALAPVLVSGMQNGTSEAIAGGWLPLSVLLLLKALDRGGAGRLLSAGVALFLAALSSWYVGVVAWMFWLAFALWPRAGGATKRRLKRAALVGCVGLILTLPVAAGFKAGVSHPDNLVGIKHQKELDTVRRSIGPADPRGWLMPGDFRSPDFRTLSRYGEEFVHCHYLGWVLVFGAAGALVMRRKQRGRGEGALLAAGGAGLLLAMGPVVCMDGTAWIIDRRLAVPLPYFLIEQLPGFSSLSLLYRLAIGPALALSLLSGLFVARSRRPWLSPLLVLLCVLELRLVSPVAGLPQTTEMTLDPAFETLAEAPDGGVINYPVAGGRSYLYEQIVHHKPLTGSLNFPNNTASRLVWAALLQDAEEGGLVHTRKTARRQKIRYLIIHQDESARPDMHDAAVRALEAAQEPIAQGPGVRIHALW